MRWNHTLVLFFLAIVFVSCQPQTSAVNSKPVDIEGEYRGILHGKRIPLLLEYLEKPKMRGAMKDGQSLYFITAEYVNDTLKGIMQDTLLDVHFNIYAVTKGTDSMYMYVTMVKPSVSATFSIPFVRFDPNNPSQAEDASEVKDTATNKIYTIDERIVGTWLFDVKSTTPEQPDVTEYIIFHRTGAISAGSFLMADKHKSLEELTNDQELMSGVVWGVKDGYIYLNVNNLGKDNEIVLGKYTLKDNKMTLTETATGEVQTYERRK